MSPSTVLLQSLVFGPSFILFAAAHGYLGSVVVDNVVYLGNPVGRFESEFQLHQAPEVLTHSMSF